MKIVCDIDGVLADVRKYVKEYLLEGSDWKTYFSHTEEFPPIPSMIELLYALKSRPSREVLLVTGRPESNRESTEKWLKKNLYYKFLPKDLLMRPSGDSRLSYKVKMDTLRDLKPDLIIDDDPAVVKAATKEGFIVLQVHGFRATKNDNVPFKEVT